MSTDEVAAFDGNSVRHVPVWRSRTKQAGCRAFATTSGAIRQADGANSWPFGGMRRRNSEEVGLWSQAGCDIGRILGLRKGFGSFVLDSVLKSRASDDY